MNYVILLTQKFITKFCLFRILFLPKNGSVSSCACSEHAQINQILLPISNPTVSAPPGLWSCLAAT